ncbi:lipopolysaccharide biosynthesis protein [Bacillus sp. mrc49]|uniref:lipopolysaccharide biosynthesis protein n=1 Tax=Bacillus sp. mrc49 TaxID=2054913 RepID=UPI000C2772F3|nr:sugar translocase [Bacillus sp. mrc49]PJN91801.1 sugar translocase [Bacillus sp. mrc49]
MRIQNSLKNIFFGLTGQFISVFMGFAVRTALIYTLGIEYTGIDGLFSSILIMLSLANLGFDTAIIYSLYKPLANKDIQKIKALMNLYQKAYRMIGLIVFLLGMMLLPFIPNLLHDGKAVDHLNIIYLLFLVNSVSSYYFVYKQAIIIADQKSYIISKIHNYFIITSNIIQILILLITKNYILLLSFQVVIRIIENVYVVKKVHTLYPYMKEKNDVHLNREEKKEFYKNLYALFLYKVSGVVINGTDNIIISKYVGIIQVGIYSNYLLIISTLSTFISHIFYSLNSSVGNLVVTEDVEKKYFLFRVIHFANFWIYGLCTLLIWNLINPFIIIWLGEQYIFNKFILLSILLNFLTAGMQNASTTYRQTTGLFNKGKYRPIIAAVINIVVSVILVQFIGISGVFIGTVISRLCTYFWYDPFIIFKYVFKRPVIGYFMRYVTYLMLIIISILITETIYSGLHSNINIIYGTIISLFIPNLLFYMVFRKSEEFIYISNIVWSLLKKRKNKIVEEKIV